jgi:hypothetical protein
MVLAAALVPGMAWAQAPSQNNNGVPQAEQAPDSSYPGTYAPQPARVLHFTKPPNSALVPKLDWRSRYVAPKPEAGNQRAGRPPVSPARNSSVFRPTAFQAPQQRGIVPPPGEEAQVYEVQLEPPGPLRLFRLESEKALQERIRQEVRDRTPPGATPERTIFPEEPPVSRQPYRVRTLPPGNMVAEPSYLCYDRLYFEQKNFERYGWDLGPITPFLSAAGFYWDLVTLPYHLATAPCRQYECSAGYCLPGSPVPLLLYPPERSLTGFIIEAGTITALFAIFP